MTEKLTTDIGALITRMSREVGTNGKPKVGDATRVVDDLGVSRLLRTVLAEIENDTSSGDNDAQ